MTHLESAIAPRLRAGTHPGRPAPEFDSYTARFDERVTQVTIAYFGAQGPGAEAEVRELAAGISTPDHHEFCRYTDEAGYDTSILVAYWLDPAEPDTRRWTP